MLKNSHLFLTEGGVFGLWLGVGAIQIVEHGWNFATIFNLIKQ